MSDFLERNGFEDTVRSLQREARNLLNHDILSTTEITNLVSKVQSLREATENGISRTQSLLFEWWQVFWKILREKNRDLEKEIGDKQIHMPDEIIKNNQSQLKTTDITKYRLDMRTLGGIERCLKQAQVLNKDLNRLSKVELKRIEALLKTNKIPSNVWQEYLSLCKEYQKANPPSKINCEKSTESEVNGYLGVIDQINQPVDSRELLILRQSLYQEFTKKQHQQQQQQQQKRESNLNIVNNFDNNNLKIHEEEVNFDDFMNEYLL